MASHNTVLVSTEPLIEEPPGGLGKRRLPVTAVTESFVQSVLDYLNIDNWEVSILYCGDDYIQQLNNHYRGKDEPTDVLSFASADSGQWTADSSRQPAADASSNFQRETARCSLLTAHSIIAGDIVISFDSLRKNCEEFGVLPNEELKRLLVHGVLHLNGYDHEGTLRQSNFEEMLILQERILHFFSASVIIEESDGSI